MKKALLIAVVVLALVVLNLFRCRTDPYTVLRLKEVPEIDATALVAWMEFKSAEIEDGKLYVAVYGEAKTDLAAWTPVVVERFVDEERIDTLQAAISLSREPRLPEGYVFVPGGGPPPYDFNIYAGDPVRIAVDATMEGGYFTRLALGPTSPGR